MLTTIWCRSCLPSEPFVKLWRFSTALLRIRRSSYQLRMSRIPRHCLLSMHGANIVEEKALTCTKFMTLMQSGFAGRDQNKPCFEYGSTDHWKKECPKLKNQQGCCQQNGQTGPPCGNGQTHCNGSQSKN
jgi:hypothetical protein